MEQRLDLIFKVVHWLVQIFSDKPTTDLESCAIEAYPVHAVMLSVRKDVQNVDDPTQEQLRRNALGWN